MNNELEQKLLGMINELEERIETLEAEIKKIKNLKENSTEKVNKKEKILLKD
jgi:uncharacterized small protein (DUF1192 family)